MKRFQDSTAIFMSLFWNRYRMIQCYKTISSFHFISNQNILLLSSLVLMVNGLNPMRFFYYALVLQQDNNTTYNTLQTAVQCSWHQKKNYKNLKCDSQCFWSSLVVFMAREMIRDVWKMFQEILINTAISLARIYGIFEIRPLEIIYIAYSH